MSSILSNLWGGIMAINPVAGAASANNPKPAAPKPSSAPNMSSIYNQDPKRVVSTIGGKNYNYAGDLIAGPDNSLLEAYNKMTAATLAAINANRTPVPRYISYDQTASWNKAREMATQAVSPVYQQKMTDFINRQQVELGRKQEDTTSGKSALDLALSRLLEDTGTQRTRTSEDTASTLQDINATQAANERQDSLNFNAADRAATEGVGAAGLGDSGLGRQQIEEAQLQHRNMSNEAVRQTDNKIAATNTLMSRTFEDLGTKETRSTSDTTQGKAKLDLDLERFIGDQAYELDQTQKQNEAEKQAAIEQKAGGIQGQLVDQWIQSLAGKGYTAQEIANAASIYK